MSLSTTIKSIQDIMRKDVGVDGDAQRIGQLVWMLFLKIYDDRESEQELLDDNFSSVIPEALRWRNWAGDDEGMTGEELLDFVNLQLFPKLKELRSDGPGHDRALLIHEVFADAYNYMKSGTLMRQVINRLNGEVDFNDSKKRHALGEIYEKVLRDLQGAGNAGEYYTPRPVTQFAVDMIDPKLGESILDPACGTGGFLACAVETIRAKQVKKPRDEARLQASIHGVEKKPLPHLLCTTNMILHGIDVPNQIRHDNTLSRPLRDYSDKDRMDIVVTNPPFGGMEEDGIENNFPADFRTRETADLFLVLIMTLLKKNGRAAVVLPDGSFFGEGAKTRIKARLLEECNVHTIVRLPNGVFAPYTTIATNLVFIDKGRPTKEVWYYRHRPPKGRKNYTKTFPLLRSHLEPVAEWWGGRKESEVSWKVPLDEIIRRDAEGKIAEINLDSRHPSERSVDEVAEDADEIIGEVLASEEGVLKLTREISKLIENLS